MKNKEMQWSAHVCKCSTCEIQVACLKWCRTVVQLYSNTIFRRRTFRLNVFEWTKKFKEFISTIYSCSSSSMCEQIRASHDVVHEANIHHPPAYTPTTHQPAHLPTHPPTYPPTHPSNHPRTHPPTHTPALTWLHGFAASRLRGFTASRLRGFTASFNVSCVWLWSAPSPPRTR